MSVACQCESGLCRTYAHRHRVAVYQGTGSLSALDSRIVQRDIGKDDVVLSSTAVEAWRDVKLAYARTVLVERDSVVVIDHCAVPTAEGKLEAWDGTVEFVGCRVDAASDGSIEQVAHVDGAVLRLGGIENETIEEEGGRLICCGIRYPTYFCIHIISLPCLKLRRERTPLPVISLCGNLFKYCS